MKRLLDWFEGENVDKHSHVAYVTLRMKSGSCRWYQCAEKLTCKTHLSIPHLFQECPVDIVIRPLSELKSATKHDDLSNLNSTKRNIVKDTLESNQITDSMCIIHNMIMRSACINYVFSSNLWAIIFWWQCVDVASNFSALALCIRSSVKPRKLSIEKQRNQYKPLERIENFTSIKF